MVATYPRPLRICHLGKYYPPAVGGIETHVRTLARAQAELGADVQVLCLNHTNDQGDAEGWRSRAFSRRAATDRVDEWDGPVRVTRLGRAMSVARFDVCPGIRSELANLCRQPLDILHLHVPNPTLLLALATVPTNVAVVVGYHSDIVRQKTLALALRPFERQVFRRAARILAASPNYQHGSRVLQRFANKVQLLSYGLDLNGFFQPCPVAYDFARQLQISHGDILWLTAGRLVYYKGIHVALEALRHVPGKLLVVGTGPLENELRDRATTLGVSEHVIWAGRLAHDELVGAFLAAKALWFPSNVRSEAFGLVQLEAMACGCPVINTNIPGSGVSWVSRHDESGLTVPVNDAAALAAAANQLLEQPMLRAKLSRGALARAHDDDFHHRHMAQRSLELYGEVLRERGQTVGAPRSEFSRDNTKRVAA